MRTAMRIDENPCLDAALAYAEKVKKPLLVYQGLSERYRYASDRHHRFILEGVRDLQRQCTDQKIHYLFHLEREGFRAPRLKELAQKSVALFTEDMPSAPASTFLEALKPALDCPIFCVDTACVVPMQLLGKAFTRAFEYRNATKTLYQERISKKYPSREVKRMPLEELPFKTLDLNDCDLNLLCGQCRIDHTIPKVADTAGGSDAGYERWQSFLNHGLKDYATLRNDPLKEGVSRMSAYLHYGMVSPFRLAREAAEEKNAGAQKYLDELLIWRELAYRFCFYHPNHGDYEALPKWARDTLKEHDEPREKSYTFEEILRGKTRSELFNAAQLSLLRRGELHNNVRMTWGKAFLTWLPPEQAFDYMIDLNHRLALDGRDPASYGGLLWCFGQFDRPFPASPYFGQVRTRPLQQHEKRMNVELYKSKTRAQSVKHLKVAVVGAGLAGSFCARALSDQGLKVTLFDKSRGVGGRMSTRRNGQDAFDHGAQYFRVRDRRFKEYVERFKKCGVVARFANKEPLAVYRDKERQEDASFKERYVATPTMTALCKYLVEGLDLQSEKKATRLAEEAEGQVLYFEDGHQETFDRVVFAMPAPQILTLVKHDEALVNALAQIKMLPTLALMVSLKHEMVNWPGAFLNDEILSWASLNQKKEGRPAAHNLVLHATPHFSKDNFEADDAEIRGKMISAFEALIDKPLEVKKVELHRWRYALGADNPKNALGYLCNDDRSIFCCGDWASGDKVEGAFLSGMACAGALLRDAAQ